MKKLLFLTLMMNLICLDANADLISEFEPNPDGTDPMMQFIEISGLAGSAFSLSFLSVEAEGAGIGVIDSLSNFAGTYDANGLATLTVTDFENPAYTVLLVSGFDAMAAMVGTDLDTDNDGVLDVTPWTSITDSLNIPDGGSVGSGDIFYGATGTTVPPMGFDDEPISVFRDSVTGDWYAVHEDSGGTGFFVFNAAGIQVPGSSFNIDPTVSPTTFGSLNPTLNAVPEPSCFLAIAMVGMLAVRRRR